MIILSIVASVLVFVAYVVERRRRIRYQHMAENTRMYLDEYRARLELVEIDKFSDYLAAVSQWYESRRGIK